MPEIVQVIWSYLTDWIISDAHQGLFKSPKIISTSLTWNLPKQDRIHTKNETFLLHSWLTQSWFQLFPGYNNGAENWCELWRRRFGAVQKIHLSELIWGSFWAHISSPERKALFLSPLRVNYCHHSTEKVFIIILCRC